MSTRAPDGEKNKERNHYSLLLFFIRKK